MDCKDCDAKCCRYVCVRIDKPKTIDDFEEIMWYVAHKNVLVYQDYENDWYVEFKTDCEYLDKNNNCKIHPNNPNNKTDLKPPYVCLEHSSKTCEANGDSPYKKVFKELSEVNDYIKKRFPKRNFSKFKFIK